MPLSSSSVPSPLVSVCPKCGFEQPGSSECKRCGVIFSKFKPRAKAAQIDRTPVIEEPARRGVLGVFSRVYRILSWVSLASTVIIFVLILRQAPTPSIQIDLQAADRVAEKMTQLQTAMQVGQSHSVALNEAELNQWMHDNLAIVSTHEARQAGIPVPAGHDASVEEVQSALKDIRMNLTGNQLRAHAMFALYGKEISLELEGTVETRDGFIRLKPTAGKLGSLPIPSSTLDRVVRQLFESPQNRESFRLSPQIESIRIENSTLVIATK